MSKNDSIGPDTIVQRSLNIVFNALDDELLAIDAEAGYCYSLNEVAGDVWDLIGEPTRVRSLCAKLCEKFAIDETMCLHDVLDLLQKLSSAGLVRICSA